MLIVGIPKEILAGEKRVSASPETVTKMCKAGMTVFVETQAGLAAGIEDKDYVSAGATILPDHASVFAKAAVILKVQPPLLDKSLGIDEINLMQPQTTLIAPLALERHPDLLEKLMAKQITAFSLDRVPRIARAQSMDILSSMSNLAGYKSVILAADYSTRIFPMMTTAAGTLHAAKVIVIGAGVAGLQAIATARRLGGVVIAFDTRPAAREQVKSLGAEFVSLETSHEQSEDKGGYARAQTADFYKNEQAIIRQYSREADIIITTALIPQQRAPLLLTAAMVKEMRPGSVIVDLAIEQEGNCELSVPGQIVLRDGVTLIALKNLPSTLPLHASQLYSRNAFAFLNYIASALSDHSLDMTDDIIKNCLVTLNGKKT